MRLKPCFYDDEEFTSKLGKGMHHRDACFSEDEKVKEIDDGPCDDKEGRCNDKDQHALR